jgi:hypothetical protein
VDHMDRTQATPRQTLTGHFVKPVLAPRCVALNDFRPWRPAYP